MMKRIFTFLLWLFASTLVVHSQSSSNFTKRFQRGKEAYSAAVAACKKGDKSKARQEMTNAKQYFNAALIYASAKEKPVCNQWLTKCSSFAFDCKPANEGAPHKQPSAAQPVKVKETWNVAWNAASRTITLRSSKNSVYTYSMVSVSAGALADGTVVNRFMIGSTEVTELLWDAVMNDRGQASNSTLPKTDISWNDCTDFLARLNSITGERFRLPEAYEWQFAAQGGNSSFGYTFSGSNSLGDVTHQDQKLHPVGKKTPNELRLYDMTGNVWEWCNTSMGGDKLMKGGGYFEAALGITKKLMPKAAEHQPATYKSGYCGLRLAMSE